MAGGSLICKIQKAWRELETLGLLEEPSQTRIHGAQAAGCAPIAEAAIEGRDSIRPVRKPQTIAHSLAIGNPADGFYAVRTMAETGGTAAAVPDDEIVRAMRLLAETEGIFTETAGGVTLGATIQLIERGAIGADDSVVICSTGQGLKTMDALAETLPAPRIIAPKLSEFDHLVEE
jgi:threonine synthase